MIRFPPDFLWGAATSAYQVEGDNSNSDWWDWEERAGKERSGQACRQYDLFERDFDLARGLHQNAHRFSVEWARVEFREGQFSEDVLRHYADVLRALRARRIEPVVTLHHFTNPAWLAKDGGWEDGRVVARFLRYCKAVVKALAPYVRYWITINEPTIYESHAYLFGVWPPQGKSLRRMLRVDDHLALAHIKAYRAIHDIYEALNLPSPSVSIAQHMMALVPCTKRLRDKFAAFLRHKVFNEGLLDKLIRRKALDFIGVNYYSRQLVDLKKWGITNLFRDVCESGHHPVAKNSLGWDIYPEGLCEVLLKLKKYKLPVMIAENGICTADDAQRWQFIRDHLASVHRAMGHGVPVIGYLYWALLDNFEWDKGFRPRFGLIDVDYATFQRTVRDSAKKYARVCESGILES